MITQVFSTETSPPQMYAPPLVLKVVIWNVWYRASTQDLLSAMRELDADIWLLQELTTSSRYNPGDNIPEIISEALGLNGVYVENRAFGSAPHHEGIGVFSRYPIESHSVATLSQGGTLRGAQHAYRRYLQAQVLIPFFRRLTFGLAHLSYPLPLGIGSKRRDSELSELLSLIAAQTETYIFGGDFNAGPQSKVVSEVERHLQHLGPEVSECSWHIRNGGTANLGRRLDYAFATPDIRAAAELGEPYCSNHRPVILTIDLG